MAGFLGQDGTVVVREGQGGGDVVARKVVGTILNK